MPSFERDDFRQGPLTTMRTNQDPAAADGSRERRVGAADSGSDLDRRGLHLAFTDALRDILRWEASRSRPARH